jgi:glycerophosphoryl diester phosphodiesterase
MSAFRAAWTASADGVELDVQLSSDGAIVVFHDDDGLRTAGQRRKISSCTRENLASWDVGQWKGETFRGERLPELADVLSTAPNGSLTMIELKPPGDEAVGPLARLLKRDYPFDVAILSFELPVAARCASQMPDVPSFLNVEPNDATPLNDLIDRAVASSLTGLSVGWSERMTPDRARSVHGAGLKLAVWTVNEVVDARRARAMGVDFLMTDWPDRIIGALRHE